MLIRVVLHYSALSKHKHMLLSAEQRLRESCLVFDTRPNIGRRHAVGRRTCSRACWIQNALYTVLFFVLKNVVVRKKIFYNALSVWRTWWHSIQYLEGKWSRILETMQLGTALSRPTTDIHTYTAVFLVGVNTEVYGL